MIGLTRRMKALYFPERTRERLFIEMERMCPERAAALRQWLTDAPDAKAEDAELLLRAITVEPALRLEPRTC